MRQTGRPFTHPSVRTFLVWLVLACLLPGVIGALTLFAYQYREGRDQLERDTLRTTRALLNAVDSHLLKVQAVAQALAVSDSLADGDFGRFHRQARAAMADIGLGSNMVLRDEAGRQVLNTAVEFGKPLPPLLAPEQVRGVFAGGKPTISDVFIGPALKRPIMSVDVPVRIGGRVAYALGIGLQPEHLNAILKAQNLPRDWVAGVFDRTGTIFGRTHDPDQFVGRKASPKLLEALAASPEGTLEATTVEGIPVLTFYSRSPATGWSVAIGIPRDSLQAALTRPLTLLAAGVAVLFGIGLLLARAMGSRIARSVSALTGPAMALGSGGQDPLPAVHFREAAELASAIERAAALLRERDGELAEAHRLARFGTWHWDIESGQVAYSPALRDIFGRDVPPFPEQRGTLLSVESWERVDAAAREAARTGGYDLELEAFDGNGAPLWIHAKCLALRDGSGKVTALRGTLQDITERKRFEASLRESEEKLQLFIRYAPASLAMFDREMRYLAASRRWIDDYGLAEDGLVGRSHYEVFPEMPQRWKEAHRRALTGEVVRSDEDRFQREGGGSHWLRWEVRPWLTAKGTVGGIVIFSEDVTRYKQALEEIHRLNTELERRVEERTAELTAANRELDSFAYAVSHDLRAPLRAIAGFSRILEETCTGQLGGEAHHYLQQISLACGRMGNLIDGILALSRITRDEMRRDEVDLSAIAGRILEGLASAEPERQVSWQVEPGLASLGDAGMVESLMGNLLGNAWKYTSRTAGAAIRVYRDGEWFCVADNGAGFDPAQSAKLFQPFQRLHSQSQFPGIGIGLATALRIVQRHGGEIGATGSPGQGAVFRFRLGPAAREGEAFPAGGTGPAATGNGPPIPGRWRPGAR